MFGSNFYHASIRKYVIMFGNMFNDIVIRRYNTAGVAIQTIAVPIAYGPKEKWFVRQADDPSNSKSVSVQLPRIGFEMTSMTYDSTRQTPQTIRIYAANTTSSDTAKIYTQQRPTAWNFTFVLSILVKNADDGAQILEQILPYFTPDFNNAVNLIPKMGQTLNVSTSLNDVSVEDTYEGSYAERRALIYNLTFTVKGWVFGPIKTSGIIKRVQVDSEIGSGNSNVTINNEGPLTSARVVRIITTPGMFANGSPTSNSAASISPRLIGPDDDYGFAVDITEFADGLGFNSASGHDE